jgi:hypothetical protein
MQLVRLIRETKYLDRMGFRIPETALNVSLQEEKYYAAVQSLENMVQVGRTYAVACGRVTSRSAANSEAHTAMQTFDQVLGSLSAVEVLLMSSRINDLRETMKPGQVAASALGFLCCLVS